MRRSIISFALGVLLASLIWARYFEGALTELQNIHRVTISAIEARCQ